VFAFGLKGDKKRECYFYFILKMGDLDQLTYSIKKTILQARELRVKNRNPSRFIVQTFHVYEIKIKEIARNKFEGQGL
jgi:hypothetical protein